MSVKKWAFRVGTSWDPPKHRTSVLFEAHIGLGDGFVVVEILCTCPECLPQPLPFVESG